MEICEHPAEQSLRLGKINYSSRCLELKSDSTATQSTGVICQLNLNRQSCCQCFCARSLSIFKRVLVTMTMKTDVLGVLFAQNECKISHSSTQRDIRMLGANCVVIIYLCVCDTEDISETTVAFLCFLTKKQSENQSRVRTVFWGFVLGKQICKGVWLFISMNWTGQFNWKEKENWKKETTKRETWCIQNLKQEIVSKMVGLMLLQMRSMKPKRIRLNVSITVGWSIFGQFSLE